MKKQLILVLGFLCGITSYAQEFNLPINNQYVADNPFLLSTGFQQWIGIDDSPANQSISVDGRIADRSGVGLILFNDSNGFTSQQGAQASFAHHVTLSEYNRQYLSFGLSYRFTQFEIDSSEFNRSDISIDGDISTSNNNFDVSALYRLGDFFISLNAINLLGKSEVSFSDTEPLNLTNYYAYTGFVIRNDFKEIEYEPSLLYRNFASDSRSTLDASFKLRKFFKDDYFWGGVTMRGLIDQEFTPVSVSPMVGLTKANFYFAYAYQVNVNQSSQLIGNSGSHLVTIGIDFACAKSNCGCTNNPL